MPDPNGAVILDTNAFKALQDIEIRERVTRALAAANSAIWPSALNVLEIVKTPNPAVRIKLLAVTRDLAQGRPLLPMPLRLLKQVARALIDHKTAIHIAPSGLEWIVREPGTITEQHVLDAKRILDSSQHKWDAAHQRARKIIHELIRIRGVAPPWASVADFLDQQWMKVEQLDTFIKHLWVGMKLPAAPPFEILLRTEAWRLYFEGLGATVYERCIPDNLPSRVHVLDVLQLPYMAGTNRRTLVTDDAGFKRVATAIFAGRYPDATVVTAKEFLAGDS